jgi:hypothetical protein
MAPHSKYCGGTFNWPATGPDSKGLADRLLLWDLAEVTLGAAWDNWVFNWRLHFQEFQD